MMRYHLGAESGGMSRPSTMYRSRTMKSGPQRATAGCNVKGYNMEPTAQGTLLLQWLSVLRVTNFFSLCGCSRVQGVDAIQGQQAARLPHIQHGRAFVLGGLYDGLW